MCNGKSCPFSSESVALKIGTFRLVIRISKGEAHTSSDYTIFTYASTRTFLVLFTLILAYPISEGVHG